MAEILGEEMTNPPESEKPQSAWTVLDSFTKMIVTLTSALLGLTVTFAVQVIGKTNVAALWSL